MARPSKRKLARLRNLEKAHQRLGRVPREKLQNVSVVDVTYHGPCSFVMTMRMCTQKSIPLKLCSSQHEDVGETLPPALQNKVDVPALRSHLQKTFEEITKASIETFALPNASS